MSKVAKVIVGAALVVAGAVTGNWTLILAGVSTVGGALMAPKIGKNRAAAATSVQIGEVPRQAIVGRAATAGSLVDAFNYGGKYGTDWEVLVLALADHQCAGLDGFYVNDSYVAFGGDGDVAGYGGQLAVWFRPGTEHQTVAPVLLANGPGWTANDNGAGVCHVVVAYKADASDAKNPVWPGGRPRFLWVLRGALCYDARKDGSAGGSGAHRWNDPATREYTDNPIVARYTWVRGFYACNRVGDPSQLLVGRGLSAVEAPPANVFARANLCDEIVDGERRYRVGGVIQATESFIEVEEDFAAACAGTIVQPQGCVEIDPGEARAVVATFTDDDIIVGSRVRWNHGHLSAASGEWINTVVASYIEPGQKWAEHAAPVHREPADLIADGGPREERAMLGFVTIAAQAGRIAEIRRRFGRLRGRAEVTLPPRFANIEEGDWVAWQSNRRFGGLTRTFRVEAWGSNEKWHHQLTLRQISASVFSTTVPLDDGSIAYQPPPPPAIAAPEPGAWLLTAGHIAADGLRAPALFLTGGVDDPQARFVRMEYVQSLEAPGVGTLWTDAGVTGPEVQRREIGVAAGGLYYAAVSYVIDGVQGERRVLGPVLAPGFTYPDGTPVEFLQPAEPGATDGAVVGGTPDQPGAIRDENGNFRPASDLLNEAMFLTDDGRLLIQRGGGVEQELGQVIIDALGGATAEALEAQEAALAALSTVVSDLGDDLVDGFSGFDTRVTSAETRLDAAEGSIALKADAVTVDALGATVTDVSSSLDALEGVVADKVSSVTFDALETRVAGAEDSLTALGDTASIRRSVTVSRLTARRQDEEAAATLKGLLSGDARQRDTVEALATVREEVTARVADGEAEAAARRVLAARVDAAEAASASEEIARAAADYALSTRIIANEASLGSISGSVVMETAARVMGDEALASSLTTVTTTVNGHTATIGTQAISIDGLRARYSVRLDVNGRITGWVANNDGASGGIDMIVDWFRIWSADGTTWKAPFEFRSGSVFIANAAIENLSVTNLKIAGNTISLPINIDGTSVSIGPAAGEHLLLESPWLSLGPNGANGSAIVGFYCTLRTNTLAGGGPDNAAEYTLYCDKGAGYQVIGYQRVGIEITSGNAYYWIPVAMVEVVSDCSSARFAVTVKAIDGPQGRAARASWTDSPSLVIQGAKR